MPQNLVSSPLCPSEKVTEQQLATDLAVIELGQSVQALNRRSFFSNLGALGAATAAAGLMAYTPSAKAQTTPAAAAATILEVLNFALNLEYLEANLYINVTGGTPLTAFLGGGASVSGLPGTISLDPQTLATFQNLVQDETHHIELLRELIFQLGSTPINQPAIDYSLGGKMKITTQAQLLAATRQFTAVGTSAYAGGAQYLVSNPTILTGAAEVLGAESQHLGAINYLCNLQGVVSPAVDATDVPPSAPNKFFTLTPTTAQMVATDQIITGPALGPVRTPQQVLGIVYGVSTPATTVPPAGITSGGFFPQGLNGVIKST